MQKVADAQTTRADQLTYVEEIGFATSVPEPTENREHQVQDQLHNVADRLIERYAQLPADAVQSHVDEESARFADARVRAFIPVLVERAVRSRLDQPIGGSG